MRPSDHAVTLEFAAKENFLKVRKRVREKERQSERERGEKVRNTFPAVKNSFQKSKVFIASL